MISKTSSKIALLITVGCLAALFIASAASASHPALPSAAPAAKPIAAALIRSDVSAGLIRETTTATDWARHL